MTISSRFSVAIHMLTLVALSPPEVISSDFLARSVNTNPALIRKIMAMLKKAELIQVKPGVAGATLTKSLTEISLLEIYQAVAVVEPNELFGIHDQPNPACPIGRNIQATIEPIFITAQSAMERVLEQIMLSDVVKDIEQLTN
ncbi:Rrf2 family transcriptional regulator [Exiguobacterium aestuarii]|uniref:Rrf2 family transcriptional regulator n=1 Tax=Exiguobacterium aestuarii TaxID=273527 RepID=UPI001CD5EAA3|nr:Rrf2 family transcriptional regulator [Exiguobacterium aestuarii]MCA0981269.1 Rrf2 family transcriptional regulator [Exiguobacterium aestuarii]